MPVTNSEKASEYLESLKDPVSRSAAIAIHLAWLKAMNSPLEEVAEVANGIDLLLLYRAMVEAFSTPEKKTQGSMRLLHEITKNEVSRIRTCSDAFVEHLRASGISTNVIESKYSVLFRRCANAEILNAIETGAVCKHSQQLGDPDFW